MVPYKSNRKFL